MKLLYVCFILMAFLSAGCIGEVEGMYGDGSGSDPNTPEAPLTKLALGQPSLTTNLNHKYGFEYPWRGIKMGGKFLVTDGPRVLIYNSMPTTAGVAPDVVIGQKDAYTKSNNTGGVNASSVNYVSDISTDGSRLIVTDSSNHRILIWNSLPTTNYSPADIVVGQPDMTSNANNNGGLGAATLSYPGAAHSDGTKLYVADSNNYRVLIWNTIPTANGTAADVVLGAANFTTTGAGAATATDVNYPWSIWSNGTVLTVGDYYNNRVLVWNTVPTVNNTAANIALGQPDLTSNAANNGGLSASSLDNPAAGLYNGSQFAVSDYGNNRVLIWNSLPTTSGQAADIVLGQPDMTSNTANNGGVSAQSMFEPWSMDLSSSELIVADYSNHRILAWDSIPTTNQTAADHVIGQPNFSSNPASAPINGVSALSLSSPYDFASDGTKIAVADYSNHRVLIWNSIPDDFNQPADVVLGQPDMTSFTPNNGGVSASSLYYPIAVDWDGQNLLVADNLNHRVLIWNGFPTTNGQAADLVLGQPNMTSNSANNGGRSAQTLNYANRAFSDGTRVLVQDYLNHRVLIWNSFPTTNGQAADLVLGQPDMTSGANNNGGRSAQSLSYPSGGVFFDGTKLYVSDTWNYRVLIWNSFPTVNQQAADVVLGQPDMTSGTANNGGLSAQSMQTPRGIFVESNTLWVSDTSNHRILKWNTIPTTNQQAADAVFGQTGFTTNDGNGGDLLSGQSLQFPWCYKRVSGISYICDSSNHRILIDKEPSF